MYHVNYNLHYSIHRLNSNYMVYIYTRAANIAVHVLCLIDCVDAQAADIRQWNTKLPLEPWRVLTENRSRQHPASGNGRLNNATQLNATQLNATSR